MIRIIYKDTKDMVSHAEKESPIEACGILAGRIVKTDGTAVKEVLKVYRCRNELYSQTEYRIDAEEQLRIFNEIETSGLDLLGFYHSHPYGQPRPSQIDEARGNYYGYSYVIVSLFPTKISSWILEEDGFREEELLIVSDPES